MGHCPRISMTENVFVVFKWEQELKSKSVPAVFSNHLAAMDYIDDPDTDGELYMRQKKMHSDWNQ